MDGHIRDHPLIKNENNRLAESRCHNFLCKKGVQMNAFFNYGDKRNLLEQQQFLRHNSPTPFQTGEIDTGGEVGGIKGDFV